MEFSIQTEELSKGLYRAQGIVEKKTAMPILSNVLFEASQGKVLITATDLEVGMTGEHPAEVAKEGSITVSARHLYDIVRSLPKGTVKIKKLPNQWAEIRSGNIEFKMMGMSPEDFQGLPDVAKASLFKVVPGMLKEMIEKVAYAISSDETRYNLNGAYLEKLDDEAFRMVATDGHRLAMLDAKLAEKGGKPKFQEGVIIPRKGLMEIKRLLEAEPAEAFLGLDGTNLVFRVPGVTVVMRLLDGQFPEYRHVIPEKQKITIGLDRKAFIDSLRRISILASDRTSGVRLLLEKNKLVVTTSNPDLGEAKEELQVEYPGSELTIGFNARYLIDALSAIPSDRVDLSVEDDLSPGVLKPGQDDRYTCVVMPMRI
ncbi:MAG TPA: DNA polymerase III subunit beta [Myxococcota bacterium]|nr:DNA polymerase III subunit beta [Myxococcota bacterium]HRY92902.1 DNA polymerase III subunit beta [Myxococcota bacterium]HSA20895.1 DNA polymerase III subunit beta [Myxococcota bacterium]